MSVTDEQRRCLESVGSELDTFFQKMYLVPFKFPVVISNEKISERTTYNI